MHDQTTAVIFRVCKGKRNKATLLAIFIAALLPLFRLVLSRGFCQDPSFASTTVNLVTTSSVVGIWCIFATSGFVRIPWVKACMQLLWFCHYLHTWHQVFEHTDWCNDALFTIFSSLFLIYCCRTTVTRHRRCATGGIVSSVTMLNSPEKSPRPSKTYARKLS